MSRGLETLSEAQKQLARRCATVALECEKLEARAVFGEQIDLDTHGQMIDRIVRAFQRLGIKRISRDAMPNSRRIPRRPGGGRRRRASRRDDLRPPPATSWRGSRCGSLLQPSSGWSQSSIIFAKLTHM